MSDILPFVQFDLQCHWFLLCLHSFSLEILLGQILKSSLRHLFICAGMSLVFLFVTFHVLRPYRCTGTAYIYIYIYIYIFFFFCGNKDWISGFTLGITKLLLHPTCSPDLTITMYFELLVPLKNGLWGQNYVDDALKNVVFQQLQRNDSNFTGWEHLFLFKGGRRLVTKIRSIWKNNYALRNFVLIFMYTMQAAWYKKKAGSITFWIILICCKIHITHLFLWRMVKPVKYTNVQNHPSHIRL